MTSGTGNSLQKLSVDNKLEMISTIRKTLIEMAEPEYQRFSSKLLPGVDNILGVRLPKLRKYARQIMKAYGTAYLDTIFDSSYCIAYPDTIFDKSCETKYLDTIANKSYRINRKGKKSDNESIEFKETIESAESMEEVLLQGMLIGQLRPETEKKSGETGKLHDEITIGQIQDYIRKYVPKISNWSTCDSFCAGLKITKEFPGQMWEFLQEYFVSERDYDVRFGMVMIINYYIQDAYLEELFEIFDRVGKIWRNTNRISAVPVKEDKDIQEAQGIYYVEMALAWAISICYVQYPDKTLIYLQERQTADTVLDDFTYNKALQKIVESRCVSPEKKAEIKLMKRGK